MIARPVGAAEIAGAQISIRDANQGPTARVHGALPLDIEEDTARGDYALAGDTQCRSAEVRRAAARE